MAFVLHTRTIWGECLPGMLVINRITFAPQFNKENAFGSKRFFLDPQKFATGWRFRNTELNDGSTYPLQKYVLWLIKHEQYKTKQTSVTVLLVSIHVAYLNSQVERATLYFYPLVLIKTRYFKNNYFYIYFIHKFGFSYTNISYNIFWYITFKFRVIYVFKDLKGFFVFK
jgi:hypothetical protein